MRITLLQTEEQLNLESKSITDTWALTDKQGHTISEFDKDTLLAAIIDKGGIFGVLYTDPDYFYQRCAYFWKRWKNTFSGWFETAQIDYDPLNNYSRKEKWNDTTKDISNESSMSDRQANNHGTEDSYNYANSATAEQTDGTTGSNQEDTVAAFNSSTYTPKANTETTGSNSSTTNGTTATDSHDNTTTAGTESENVTGARATNFDRDFEHEGEITGYNSNESYQKTLTAQYELLEAWGNLYEHMADIFIKEMLITIY